MEESKSFEISVKTTREVDYWFADDWDGKLSKEDMNDIEKSVNDGFLEGEIIYYDHKTDVIHRGWWMLVEPENEKVDE